jgi:L-asparagine transporter-like permease
VTNHETKQPKLAQQLESRHVAMIAIGGIIGAGLFVGSSTSIAAVGPAVVISYGLAGLVILMVMRMLSEMATASPSIGSFTELIRMGLGDAAGFVSGWLYWFFWVVVVAIEAIAGAVVLKLWLPFEVWQIGMVLLAGLTAVNLLSTRSYGEFEFWLSSVKVTAIIAFIAAAALWVAGVSTSDTPGLTHLYAHGGFAPKGWGAVLAGVTSVIFALCGAEIATIAAAESKEPSRTIARMTASVAVRILLFYVVSVFLIVTVVPWNHIVPGQSPFTTALSLMDIPAAPMIMNIVVLVAVTSCLNSGLYVTSRILFTLAERSDAPSWLVKVNHRQVPIRATLIASLFGYCALAASIFSPELIFSFLVNASGATMLIIYLMVCVAQIRNRYQIEAKGHETLSVKMWLFPYGSIATAGAIIVVMIAMLFESNLRQQLLLSWGMTLLVTVTWVLFRRPNILLKAP